MTKVSIVEDNATFRQYLAQLIERTPEHGCICACATAEAALTEIPRHQPDVVLMDIHLPGESGIACTASFATVRTHLMHTYEKLHVRCRTEAAAKYLRSNPAGGLPRPGQHQP